MKEAAMKNCSCGLYVNGRLTNSRSRMVYYSSRTIPILPAEEWKPVDRNKVESTVHDIGKTIPKIGLRALIKVTAEDVLSVVRPKPIVSSDRHIRRFSESRGLDPGVVLGTASFDPRAERVRSVGS